MNTKAAAERHQRQLLELVRLPGNDTCADCSGRNPRWASWNLGIFICVQCAGIHRKMGTHISKVKSLTLDTWEKDQVAKMRERGNVKSNQIFNPDPIRNRPPTNMTEEERDSELEKFIRRKYEFRRFMDRSKPPPVPVKDAFSRSPVREAFSRSPSRGVSPSPGASSPLGSPEPNRRPSASRPAMLSPETAATSIARSQTAPIPSTSSALQASVSSVLPVPTVVPAPASPQPPPRDSSRVPPSPGAPIGGPPHFGRSASSSVLSSGPAKPSNLSNSVFDDLVSIQQGPAQPHPPLQMQIPNQMQQMQMQMQMQMQLQQQQQQQQQMNPWASMQAVASPSIMASSPFAWAGSPMTAHANSYPQPNNAGPSLQPQSAFMPSFPAASGMAPGSQSLPPSPMGANPFAMQQQQQQQQPSPFQAAYQNTAQPFFQQPQQQQQQQQQQQPMFHWAGQPYQM